MNKIKVGKFPHICFVAPQIYPVFSNCTTSSVIGGSEVQQSIIIRALSEAGFKISVATGDFGQPDDFELDGIRIIKIIRRGAEIRFLRTFHPNMTSIWTALKRADADVYYQRCSGMVTAVCCLFSRWFNKKFIFSSACDLDFDREKTKELFHGLGGKLYFQMYMSALRKADVLLAQHHGQAAALKKWYNREATVIPNCYSLTSPAYHVAHHDGVVLWVSTLHKIKRPELFLQLARQLPDMKFRMVGGASSDPVSAGVFERTKKEAESITNLEFVGFVPYSEVGKHFDEASIFINTSDYEGFPNTFLQAWSRGVPTVSFIDCGAYEQEKPVGAVVRELPDIISTIERYGDDNLWGRESCRVKDYFNSNHGKEHVIDQYISLLVGLDFGDRR